ncbi:MAG: hypothetical protein KGJ23_07380 [Euryarchaeota archaeon]|nr:hypothetical protein [Euryarchaeota archaeon]MDE1836422.1 hypothetical protein [Euryarchaeota archaeon]MDE1879063.1 hypothetical protein [Euryarchaeota archaeon]MDE2044170.1 hypothetical protein [Thermoplasmata archaeon]
MTLTRRSAMAPKGAYCFGCNQAIDGGAPSVRFESDLVPAPDRPELANLYFHPGHLLRYARRRNWTELASFLEANTPSSW